MTVEEGGWDYTDSSCLFSLQHRYGFQVGGVRLTLLGVKFRMKEHLIETMSQASGEIWARLEDVLKRSPKCVCVCVLRRTPIYIAK